MRIQIFLYGAMMLALGFYGMSLLDRMAALALLQGTLLLGGGTIICGLFSLKMKWHGIIGAGVIALLGTARGLINLPDFIRLLSGDGTLGPSPAIEFGFTAACLVLLLRVLRTLQQERARRMLDPGKEE